MSISVAVHRDLSLSKLFNINHLKDKPTKPTANVIFSLFFYSFTCNSSTEASTGAHFLTVKALAFMWE